MKVSLLIAAAAVAVLFATGTVQMHVSMQVKLPNHREYSLGATPTPFPAPTPMPRGQRLSNGDWMRDRKTPLDEPAKSAGGMSPLAVPVRR